jgi:hypothetical protein
VNVMTSPGVQKRARRTIRQILLIPAALAVLSAAELIFALVEYGVWDALSWVALSIPIALLVICIAHGRA